MAKLKPCPFCGGKAELCNGSTYGLFDFVYMSCRKCYARTERVYIRHINVKGTGYYTEEEAIQKAVEAWERRENDARKIV